jgi:hypothetical protein
MRLTDVPFNLHAEKWNGCVGGKWARPNTEHTKERVDRVCLTPFSTKIWFRNKVL